ncbi:MAG: DUF1572 family protein [Planctomycetota bacterium]
MSESESALAAALVESCRHEIQDLSLDRLRRCLSLLDEEAIWRRPRPELSSVGNLLSHLAGNVGQWIVSGLGGRPDHRHRAEEFAADTGAPAAELMARLEAVVAEAVEVMQGLDAAALTSEFEIQGMRKRGVDAVVHVTEHFSYHVGQIGWWTKFLTGRDLGYYAGQDLGATNPPAD